MILKGLNRCGLKELDSNGVRAILNFERLVGDTDATPTPGCFSQRVRKRKKTLGIE